MNTSRLLLAGLVASLITPAAADAGTRAWDALKGKLPKSTAIVGAADAAALRGTPSYAKLITWLTTEEKDVAQAFDLVKQSCNIDVPAAFDDVAVAFDLDGKGVVAIALAGIDQAKAESCLRTLVTKTDPKAKLVVKPAGPITVYSVGGDAVYMAWLGKDVVAISTETDQRDMLDAMIAGGAASPELATYVGKAGTKAAAWGAFVINDDDVKGGWGTLALGSTIKLALRVTAMSVKEGAKGRTEMTKAGKEGLERSAKQPELKKVFQSWKVGGKGADVTLDVSIPEASLPALVPALDKVF